MRWALLLLAGCGRIAFDPLGGGSGDDTVTGDGRIADGIGGDGVTPGGPQLVDVGGGDSPSSNQVTVMLTNGVQAGDVILACVGFRDATTNITLVGDNRGNTYSREMQTNRTNGAVSQECMVAIASSTVATVQVTANLSQAATQPSLRVLVYRGVDTSQAIQPQNSGGANIQNMNATTVTFKTGAKLVGINTADRTASIGSGFTLLHTNSFGDIAEEKTSTTTGLQNTPAMLSTAGNWVMEAIALPPL
jgi:hypothetical protein